MSVADVTPFEVSPSLVTPLTGRTSQLLCTLQAVKDQLQVSGSSLDTTLTVWIGIVGDAFASDECGLGRPFWRQRWRERLPGDGGNILVLSRWPVERVVSLSLGVDSPEAVDAADFEVVSGSSVGGPLGSRERLYRPDGWIHTCEPSAPRRYGDREASYSADYYAGWLMTDEVTTWSAAAAKTVGAWVRPTAVSALLRYECTAAGNTGGSEPAWPVTEGETVVDGGVTWTARAAAEVPTPVQQAAVLTAAAWYAGGLSLPTGIQEEQDEDHRVAYDFVALRGDVPALPPVARALLRAYR